MEKKKSYALKTGAGGAERLTLLNELLNPYSLSFLNRLGPLAGLQILDVGCGTGLMTCELAKLVGVNGRVVAIDSSQAQIDIASENAAQRNLDNVEFVCMDVHEIDSLSSTFDVIFCRFVVAHLQNIEHIVDKMLAHVKQAGFVVFEEPSDITTMFSYPPSAIFDQFKAACVQQTAIYDCDFSVAMKIFHRLKTHGYENITSNFVQPILHSARLKDQLWLGIKEIATALIESNFMSHHEIDNLIDGLKQFSHCDENLVTLFRHMQIAVQIRSARGKSNL